MPIGRLAAIVVALVVALVAIPIPAVGFVVGLIAMVTLIRQAWQAP